MLQHTEARSVRAHLLCVWPYVWLAAPCACLLLLALPVDIITHIFGTLSCFLCSEHEPAHQIPTLHATCQPGHMQAGLCWQQSLILPAQPLQLPTHHSLTMS